MELLEQQARRLWAVLARYLRAKALFKHVSFVERDFTIKGNALKDIMKGVTHFKFETQGLGSEGILIDPNSPHLVTDDYDDPDFFQAIINERDGVLDMTAVDLHKYRQYVLHGKGSLPVAGEES